MIDLKLLPNYIKIEDRIPVSYINQVNLAGFLSGLSFEIRPYNNENDETIEEFFSIYAPKDQLAEKDSFSKTMDLITESVKDYLIFIGISKEMVEERQKNKGYGYEYYTYPEYKSIIPEPLPLDWLNIAKYAVEQKEKYLRDITKESDKEDEQNGFRQEIL